LELFQWGEAWEHISYERIGEEAADVFIYLLMFADSVGIDLIEAANHKIAANEKKYPVR